MTPSKWPCSTWFLRNGSWLEVEDRVDPGLQCERIDGPGMLTCAVLAAFVEEMSNKRIELKCVNDLALGNFAPVEAAFALSAYQL